MTKPVTANIPHKLGRDEARRRIAEGFSKIQKQLTCGMLPMVTFQERWEADRLHFEGGGLGQKITGRIDVLPESVQVQVDLPDLLAAIAEKVMGRVRQDTLKLLERK